MSGSGGKTSNYQQEVGEGGGVELATTAWNKTNLGEGGRGEWGGATGFALCGAVPSKVSCFHSTTPLLIVLIVLVLVNMGYFDEISFLKHSTCK